MEEADYLIPISEDNLPILEEERVKKLLSDISKYSFIVEGYYPCFDFAARWCWENFGPYNGGCMEYYSEYPACPLVLATQKIEDGVSTYSKIEEHQHQGRWTVWLFEKTGYDYGVGAFIFDSEDDLKKFQGKLNEKYFGLGENYLPVSEEAK